VRREDAPVTGLCLVRAELDPYAGLRITVTVLGDVARPADRVATTAASIDAAIDRVRTFLLAFSAKQA
jgi:hypothetical protein